MSKNLTWEPSYRGLKKNWCKFGSKWLEISKNLIWGPSYGCLKKNVTKIIILYVCVPLTINVCPLIFLSLVMSSSVIFLSVYVYITGAHRISLQYRCTQNQFTVEVYTKPVYNTGVHKTGLQYRCTQNKFTAQVYIKLFFITAVYETRLEYTL